MQYFELRLTSVLTYNKSSFYGEINTIDNDVYSNAAYIIKYNHNCSEDIRNNYFHSIVRFIDYNCNEVKY